MLLTGLATPATAGVKSEVIHFTHGGVEVEGLIAWDDEARGPRPGVVIIHGGWGYSDNVRAQAERLARSGYVGYAVDMYGMGPVSTHLEDDRGARQLLEEKPLLRAMRFSLAVERLKRHPSVDPDRISAIGYCWGGEVILEMARAGATFDALITFAGILSTDNPAPASYVNPRILVLHGDSDPYAPLEQVEAFRSEMTAAGAEFEIVVYPDVEHAFSQPYARDANMDGIAYDEEADNDSWNRMLALLDEVYE
jgi:dienelactone hydrolase